MRRGWPVLLIGLAAAAILVRSSPNSVPRRTTSSRAGVVPSAVPDASATADAPTSTTARTGGKRIQLVSRGCGGGRAEESLTSRSLGWLLRAQKEDGSWGEGIAYLDGYPVDPVAMTSIALLAFLGAGYTPSSKEIKGDLPVGDAVRKGIQWLRERQRDDGTFPTAGDPTLAQAMGALALSEAYNLANSPAMVESAQKATDALASAQAHDGSWNGPYRSGWAAMALASARISGLNLEEDVRDRLRTHARTQLERGPNLPALVEGVFFFGEKLPELYDSTVAAVLASPVRADRPEATYWYWGALALYQIDGPKGERWKAWSGSLKEALSRVVQPGGHWEGTSSNDTLLKTGLWTLCSEIYYRYGNAFGERAQ